MRPPWSRGSLCSHADEETACQALALSLATCTGLVPPAHTSASPTGRLAPCLAKDSGAL